MAGAWTTIPLWTWPVLWLVLALALWMTARILIKAGFAPWWALLLVVPVVYVVGLWLFAFLRWPRIDRIAVTPPSDYAGGWNVPERPTGRDDDHRR